MTPKPLVLLAKIPLGVANRDGEAFVVKTVDERCFLVLEADTFHNAEVFCGMKSTEQIQISVKTFDTLNEQSKSQIP